MCVFVRTVVPSCVWHACVEHTRVQKSLIGRAVREISDDVFAPCIIIMWFLWVCALRNQNYRFAMRYFNFGNGSCFVRRLGSPGPVPCVASHRVGTTVYATATGFL